MEQTINTGSSSKVVIWIVVILVIILGIWLSMRKDIEAPADDTNTPTVSSNESPTPSEKSQLQASVGEAMNFDNEASMKEVDKEFQ